MEWTIVGLVALRAAVDVVETIYISGFIIAWDNPAVVDGWSTIGDGITEKREQTEMMHLIVTLGMGSPGKTPVASRKMGSMFQTRLELLIKRSKIPRVYRFMISIFKIINMKYVFCRISIEFLSNIGGPIMFIFRKYVLIGLTVAVGNAEERIIIMQ